MVPTVKRWGAAPGAVRNLAAANSSAFSVRVSWEPPRPDCARGYSVRWCPYREGDRSCDTAASSTHMASLPAGAAGYLVPGLKNCKPYLVAVSAVGRAGGESQPAYVRAGAGYTAEGEPIQNLRLWSVGSQGARVSWDIPRSTEYCVTECRACLEEHYETGGGQPLSCSTQLSSKGYWSNDYDLQPCTLYTLTLMPHDADGSWMNNYTISFTTGSSEVRSVSVTEKTTLVPEVSWTAPLSRTCLQWYRVCWKPSGGGADSAETCGTAPAGSRALNMTGVVGCTGYDVAVTAVGAIDGINGTSDESNTTFTTGFADPGPLSDLKCTVTSSNSIRVQWDAPAKNVACIDDYEVCLKTESREMGPTCDLVPRGQLSWASDPGLQACAAHVVSVAYRHQESEVDRTSATVRTGPGAVEDLTLTGSTGTSVLVSWRNPLANAECAEEVVVSWRPQDADAQQPGGWNSTRVPASRTEFNITGLAPCSNYSVSVMVTAAGSIRSTSETILAPTLNERAGSARDVRLQMEGSTAMVRWRAPTQAPTCATGYQVCWRRAGAVEAAACARTAGEVFALEGRLDCEVYEASVRTVSIDGSLSAAVNASLDLAVPSKVENLAVAAGNSCQSVAVEWEPPSSNADCVSWYQVCWGEASSANRSCIQVPYDDIDMAISGLERRSRYEVSLAAVGPTGELSEESYIEADTGPAAVEELTLTGSTETSMLVSWRNPLANAECAEEVVVSWRPQNADAQQLGGWNSTRVPASGTEFNVTGLAPCSNYSVSVAVNAGGGVVSANNTVLLHTAYESPAAVSRLSLRTGGSPAAELSWDPPRQPAACVRGHQVCWRAAPSPLASARCAVVAAPASSYSLGGLPACEQYVLAVSSLGAGGLLSAAAYVDLDLATPGEVSALAVENRTADSLAVGWGAPLWNAECARGYEVCVAAAGGAGVCEKTGAAEKERRLAGLQPGSGYTVTVTALGQAGQRSAPRSLQATTDEATGNGGARPTTAAWSLGVLACAWAHLLGLRARTRL
ncbi:fibronectin-like [Bacillus rossius redtenbacheri]|uniref:fibronectin-like n=1 Tax=Bacillus rossius redtenbacheri TaxID=93214 RepID=UPI002FDE0D45